MGTLTARVEGLTRLGGPGATHTEAVQTPDPPTGSPTTPGHTRLVNTLDKKQERKVYTFFMCIIKL